MPRSEGSLTVTHLELTRGASLILASVSLKLGPGDRLGVVGPNGVGKTSLLRVLAGLDDPDSGTVRRLPPALAVGYLSQESDADGKESLGAYLARRTGIEKAGRELDELTERMAAGVRVDDQYDLLNQYDKALERFLLLGGADFEQRAGTVCAELGIAAPQLDMPASVLSGGQSSRARLAAILLSRFDVLLLDEPTNDLDFDGLARLESFLRRVPAAVVVVSHDRAFLDRSVTRILELEEHSHRGVEYAGGWSEFVRRRNLRHQQQSEQFEEWRTERRRLEDRIRRQRTWAVTGVSKERKSPRDNDKAQRDFRINRTERLAAKVRSSERAIGRLRGADKPWDGWQLHMDLEPGTRSGQVVSRLEGTVVERDEFILGPVDLEVRWADRLLVTGPNGGGKSTLLATLTGGLEIRSGHRWIGPGVEFGSIDQRRMRFEGVSPLIDEFVRSTGALVEEARSILAKFGLEDQAVSRKAGSLSPGERTRAQLAALMIMKTNCLVLDEPTNHLDLPAIEQLEVALDRYRGTVLLVTHDRWLIDRLTFTKTVEVSGGKISERMGVY